MTQKIKISLLAENDIAKDGLRNVFSGDTFDILASVSSDGPLMGEGRCAEVDVDSHVIIIDGGGSGFGLGACRSVAANKGDAKVAMLLDHYVYHDVVKAFQIGVDAVIIKGILCAPLIESIKLVALGEKVFPSQLINDLTSSNSPARRDLWKRDAPSIGLSSREIEILECIMAGMANKMIARQFGICEATVKVHVKSVLRKLGVENRTQAATWGVKNGLAESETLNLRDVRLARRAHERPALLA